MQAEHDETAARADSLRGQIDQLTSALAEVEACLAEIVTTGKAIDGLALPEPAQAPAGPATVHRRIATAFNEHPPADPPGS
ncbi:hypothetical protein ACFVZJ_35835 [Streptomyces sp. NPDC058322]|uniref:hypothetical protein n=1 Tax=Streptomyces sp. NPDC058322 TaxID=3346446 RepID=UPI0036E4FE0E